MVAQTRLSVMLYIHCLSCCSSLVHSDLSQMVDIPYHHVTRSVTDNVLLQLHYIIPLLLTDHTYYYV